MSFLSQSLFYLVLALAHAHSWVEEVRHVCDNGTFCGDAGYSRGYGKQPNAIAQMILI